MYRLVVEHWVTSQVQQYTHAGPLQGGVSEEKNVQRKQGIFTPTGDLVASLNQALAAAGIDPANITSLHLTKEDSF